MKKISEHLGEIIIALACVALLITAITFFNAPISNFFSSIVAKETALGGQLMEGIEDIDISNIGVSGGSGGEIGGGAGAEVPENLTDFYTYTLNDKNTGYDLALTTEFKEALDSNTDYIVGGETLWVAGSALPNPGSTYDGKPVVSMAWLFDRIMVNTLDLSEWDTTNVTDMSQMIYGCEQLREVDLTGFDTSKVTNMSYMFSGCQRLAGVDLSGFNTSNVTTMKCMFSGCKLLAGVDLSSFDTSKVTNMLSMFQNCTSLAMLDLSSFNTSNVTSTKDMFSGCMTLNSIIARTNDDKATYEVSSNFPSGCVVTVKQ